METRQNSGIMPLHKQNLHTTMLENGVTGKSPFEIVYLQCPNICKILCQFI